MVSMESPSEVEAVVSSAVWRETHEKLGGSCHWCVTRGNEGMLGGV